ncbi:phage/plasmid primase, P4 family [Adlercreutzia sp. ZJ242]|uniref:DNA primase family protein n=1 Tax=Adlercreutzia sp. ZJ242 TaxID=2709409 RepID=UPI0013EC10D9|nr:phage/plasmid primase, P4 family [Adlercreutzia sp. ZJ242]
MRWSTADYELSDGSTVRGATAAAMRSLDALDPLSPDRPVEYADGNTREELLNYLGDLRWCESIGRCVVRGDRDMFELRDEGYLHCAVEDFLTARLLWAQDQLKRHPDERKRIGGYVSFARRQDSAACTRSMRCSVKERLRIDVSELDTSPEHLGTEHGVMSLATGELPADRADWLSGMNGVDEGYDTLAFKVTKRVRGELDSTFRHIDHSYDERWDGFVDEITDGDEDKAAFLQRALGYSLYGGNPEKATFVLWGAKRDNGKSTLMNVVKHVLGDYAGSASSGLLLVNRFENYTAANPVLAGLVGKRLVDVSEPPLGAELNGAMVKKLASGTDEISTRHLHREEFSYVPQFTVWMHCNALPVVRDPSAIDPRHMFVIEFTRSFTAEERDLTLADRFKSPDGMYTVLTWMLEGYQMYLEEGLNPPECVVRATEAWLSVSKSWLQSFLDERCDLGSDRKCPVSEFKEAARAYCEAQGETFMLRNMRNALESAGISSGRASDGSRVYKGVALLPAAKPSSKTSESAVRFGRNVAGKPTIRLT